MAVTFPASIDTGMGRCDYCDQYRMLAHIRIASETETWLLCAPCVADDHTDEEVKAAFTGNHDRAHAAHLAAKAAQEAAASQPKPQHTPPPPEPFSRCYAASVVVRNWNQEEIDDRQADRLCAAIWAGGYDEPDRFYRAIRSARVRHAARMHRELGPCDPRRKHRSGLTYNDIWCDRDSLTRTEAWRDPEPLRLLIHTLTQTLSLPVDPDWQRGDASWVFTDDVRIGFDGKRVWVPHGYERRLCLLKRRYTWLTGQEWTPYTITSKEIA